MPKSELRKIDLERADKIAKVIVDRLTPNCKKIEVAGSIRRRMPWVHDIDIVLIPSDPWNLEQEILSLARPFHPKLSGEKLKRFNFGDTQVDLYYATEDTWATLLLIRTGSVEHNIMLCSLAKQRGMKLHADGSGLYSNEERRGGRIAGDTEASIFEALGLKYVEPERR